MSDDSRYLIERNYLRRWGEWQSFADADSRDRELTALRKEHPDWFLRAIDRQPSEASK